MDPATLSVNCGNDSYWLYTVIWGALLPLFLAYVAGAAYTFQRRRSDLDSMQEALHDMWRITQMALGRCREDHVDIMHLKDIVFRLITRVDLELLHRPEDVQKEVKKIFEEFLQNEIVAEGRAPCEAREVVDRFDKAQSRLLEMLGQLTVFEALRQAWSNPGPKVPLDGLMERFVSSKK